MPIFRIDTRLCHFAHVPKCAGTAVENYLYARFGLLGFLDRRYLMVPAAQRWSRSSPQHIDMRSFNLLLPREYFSVHFAVVRHPVDRIVSVFRFQRDVEASLPKGTDFGIWLASLLRRHRRKPFYLDNHTRPMTDLVLGEAEVFRLEDGMERLVGWLDAVAGNADGPREIPLTNSYAQHMKKRQRPPGPAIQVTDADRQRVAAIYAADFERFGYDPLSDSATGTAP